MPAIQHELLVIVSNQELDKLSNEWCLRDASHLAHLVVELTRGLHLLAFEILGLFQNQLCQFNGLTLHRFESLRVYIDVVRNGLAFWQFAFDFSTCAPKHKTFLAQVSAKSLRILDSWLRIHTALSAPLTNKFFVGA